LKYLFGQNYASEVQRQPNGYHATFVRPYFAAKRGSITTDAPLLPAAASMNPETTATTTTTTSMQELIAMANVTPAALGTLFVQGMQVGSPPAGDCVRLIKLFEPLVIYCLTVSLQLLINFSSCQFV